MKPGDIYLADYGETDSDDQKLRPAIIVSLDKFNRGDDVVILPISHSADPTSNFVLRIDDTEPNFRLSGLQYRPSSVKWTKPFTFPKKLLKKRLGHVSPQRLDEIRELLKSVFSYPPKA